jgi:phage shock protein C
MKRLYRRPSTFFTGVCSGLGEYFNIDPTLIRLLFIVLLFTPFPIIITYFLMSLLVPYDGS